MAASRRRRCSSTLEQLPRKVMAYRGRDLAEMDIDALLERRPQLAIIDELAHTNVPGSRHPKRWQDVEEVLDAGIDVITTLNIQHIESLNDVVARITGVRVQETVPDEILQTADEIELIDLPPEELIERLRQGKVYVPQQIARALNHFFSKGNLTALRELAMRTAAQRVDAEMVAYMRAHAVVGPWPTQERLLVCINEFRRGQGAGALRQAQGRPHQDSVDRRHRDDARRTRRWDRGARGGRRGAAARREPRRRDRHLAHRPRRRRRDPALRPRAQLLAHPDRPRPAPLALWPVARGGRRAADQAGLRFRGHRGAERPAGRPHRADAGLARGPNLAGILEALLGVGVATAGRLAAVELSAGGLARRSIYLVAVLIAGVRHGLLVALFASVAGFLAYNFFFTQPYYSFEVAQHESIIALLVFFISALFTGTLASRLRMQVENMRATQKRTETLYDFSRKIASVSKLDDVLWAAVHHLAATLEVQSLVLMPGEAGELEMVQGYPTIDDLDPKDWGAARWAWEKAEPAGRGTATLPTADWLFLPMATASAVHGVIGVRFKDPARADDPETRRLLSAVEDQIAVAIERTRLAADLEDCARHRREREAAGGAAELGVARPAHAAGLDHRRGRRAVVGARAVARSDREALAATVLEEAQRLDRYVQNLLDMTRLGYGAPKPAPRRGRSARDRRPRAQRSRPRARRPRGRASTCRATCRRSTSTRC